MSLIIATGTNLGNKKVNLEDAKNELSKIFEFVYESSIYSSPAVDYLNQPDFYNQLLEFKIPKCITPDQAILKTLALEEALGRKRDISKGPRLIDIDIIFWNNEVIDKKNLIIPHPRWQERSFVVYPLKELPFFQKVQKRHIIPTKFSNSATKI